MSYRTILVHVDESRHVDKRIEMAAAIAMAEGAHLIGAAATGISRITGLPVYRSREERDAISPEQRAQALREAAANALRHFEEKAAQLRLHSWEARLIEDEAALGISGQGGSCDLIVLGQSDTGEASLSAQVDFPEYVILNCGCPVLIVPWSATASHSLRRVLAGWNGSMVAARALKAALPLLARAELVELAEFVSAGTGQARFADPQRNAELVAYLGRHGIRAGVIRETGEANAALALLALAQKQSSDLIVMGCVAHPHFSAGPGGPGVRLGGATRAILESTTIPVLMTG